MWRTTRRAPDLDATIAALEGAKDAPHAVAWIDCHRRHELRGRSVVFTGGHAGLENADAERDGSGARGAEKRPLPARRRFALPIDLPPAALSAPVVRAFNAIYYASHTPRSTTVGIEPFFHPLDAVGSWNRLYGRRGFLQHQCVLPPDTAREGLRRILAETSDAGCAPFLAVLKRMGGQSFGLMSFPMPGYTLALDFPATRDHLALLERLDAIVLGHAGRLYLAKDARASPSVVSAGYPKLEAFRAVRRKYGLAERFGSALSRRLAL